MMRWTAMSTFEECEQLPLYISLVPVDSCLKPIKDIQKSTRRIVVRVQMRIVLIRAVLLQPAESQSLQSRSSLDSIV